MIRRIIVCDTQFELDQMYSADVQRASAVFVLEHWSEEDSSKLTKFVEALCQVANSTNTSGTPKLPAKMGHLYLLP